MAHLLVSSAFNIIDNNILFIMLADIGISHNALQYIKDYLGNSKVSILMITCVYIHMSDVDTLCTNSFLE